MRLAISIIALIGFLFPSPVEELDPSFYLDTTKINLVALEQNIFSDITRVRTAHGLPPYDRSERLHAKAKNHSRQMALERKLEPLHLKTPADERAGINPTSFWAGMSGNIARVGTIKALGWVVEDWLQHRETRDALLSRHYNRSSVGISVDRAGVLYVTLISGEEIYHENNLARLEQSVFDAINKLRSARGRPPLLLSEKLSAVASEHSRDMALKHYFSHIDRRGRSASERLRARGVTGWQAVAENIASSKGQRDPVQSAVNGWINSPRHAAILLRPDLTHTGIGVAKALDETYYFTQVFVKWNK
jgi:uncharacterized protein YkwD